AEKEGDEKDETSAEREEEEVDSELEYSSEEEGDQQATSSSRGRLDSVDGDDDGRKKSGKKAGGLTSKLRRRKERDAKTKKIGVHFYDSIRKKTTKRAKVVDPAKASRGHRKKK